MQFPVLAAVAGVPFHSAPQLRDPLRLLLVGRGRFENRGFVYIPEYQPTGNEIAVLTTSQGTIRVQLAGKDAPIHVGNFVELAQKGFYDDLKFHRYVPGFVIQGGDPNTKKYSGEEVTQMAGSPYSGLGTGGPGYSIKAEYRTNPNNVHEDCFS